MRKWFLILVKKCVISGKVKIMPFTNLYGCTLYDRVFVGPFVEIQKDVIIGTDTRISSHTFICSGVKIGSGCFIAHGVMFINDLFKENRTNWIQRKTIIGNNVRIGSNATILPVTIGDDAVIGAGAVVTKDVCRGGIVAGNPARYL